MKAWALFLMSVLFASPVPAAEQGPVHERIFLVHVTTLLDGGNDRTDPA